MRSHRNYARRPKRLGTAGQALLEFAVIAPVLITIFYGSWTGADLVANRETVGQAVRTGARVAAEAGDEGFGLSATPGIVDPCQNIPMPDTNNPCPADNQIIQAMLPVLNGHLTNVTITEIDIYQPSCINEGSSTSSPPFGAYYPGPPATSYLPSPSQCPTNNGTAAVEDRFDGSGHPLSTYQFGLNKRSQLDPFEQSVGVKVLYSYKPTVLSIFAHPNLQDYTVIRVAPVFA